MLGPGKTACPARTVAGSGAARRTVRAVLWAGHPPAPPGAKRAARPLAAGARVEVRTRSMGDGSGMAASSVRGWHTQRGHYSGVLPGHRRCAGQLPPRAARGSGDRCGRPRSHGLLSSRPGGVRRAGCTPCWHGRCASGPAVAGACTRCAAAGTCDGRRAGRRAPVAPGRRARCTRQARVARGLLRPVCSTLMRANTRAFVHAAGVGG